MGHVIDHRCVKNRACNQATPESLPCLCKRVIASGLRLILVLGMLQITALNSPGVALGATPSIMPPKQSDQSGSMLPEQLETIIPPAPFSATPSTLLDPHDDPDEGGALLLGESEKGIAIVSGGEVIDVLSGSDEVKVIVRLNEEPVAVQLNRLHREGRIPQAQLAADIRTYAANLERKRDGLVTSLQDVGLIDRVTRRFSYLVNGFAATVRLVDIPRIEQRAEVEAVYLDEELQVTLAESVPLVGAPSVWQMTDAAGNPVTGQGITVAIIDTGIDYTHPDLGGCFGMGCKVIGGYDFVNDDPDPLDDHGHGTHVAGIVAANGQLKGVAPEARLLAYKVCNEYGSCSESDVIAALERAADPDGDPMTDDMPAVINMSLGGRGASDDPLAQATSHAVDQGIVVVVAAGNNGNYYSIGNPGLVAKAITVGASTKSDELASFSSKGPADGYNIKPDIVAPGVDINSTAPGGGYIQMSGTSMASPHVAGAAALMLQLHPEWTPARIKALLMNTAQSLGEDSLSEGTGRLRVDRAARATTVIQPATLSLGRVNSSQQFWTTTGTIEISNFALSRKTYHLSLDANLPQGVDAQLNADRIEIDPGNTATVSLTLTVDNVLLPYPSKKPFAYFGGIWIKDESDQWRVPFVFIKNVQLTIQFEDWPWVVYLHDRVANGKEAFFAFPGYHLEVPLQPGIFDLFVYFEDFSSAEGLHTEYVVREGIDLSNDQSITLSRTEAQYQVDARIRFPDGKEVSAFPEDTYQGISGIFHRPSGNGIYVLGSQTSLSRTGFSALSTDYYFETDGLVQYWPDPSFYDLFYTLNGIQRDLTLTQDVRSFKTIDYIVQSLPDIPYVHLKYYFIATVDETGWAAVWDDIELCGTLPWRSSVLRAPQPETGVVAPYRFLEVYSMKDCSVSSSEKEKIGDSPFIRVEDSLTFSTYAEDRKVDRILKLESSTMEEFTFQMPPVFWAGVFQVEPTQFHILSDLVTMGDSVAYVRDQWQNLLRYDIPYVLTSNGQIIQNGELGSESDFSSWTSQYFSVGKITMDMSYGASLRGIPIQGKANASFDTRLDDRNPPYIHTLQILSNGERSDWIASGGQVRVEVIDDVALKSVDLAIDLADGRGWQSLGVSRQGDVFSADLPVIPAGRLVALKIAADDTSGNRLVNEISPAFLEQALIYFPMMMQGAVP